MISQLFSVVCKEHGYGIVPVTMMVNGLNDPAELVVKSGDHSIVCGIDLGPDLRSRTGGAMLLADGLPVSWLIAALLLRV